MKRAIAFLCAALLIFSVPVAAFGEEAGEVSEGIDMRFSVGDLGCNEDQEGDDSVGSCVRAELKSDGSVAGTITGLKMVITKYYDTTSANADSYIGWPTSTTAPTPYEVTASKTVLNAVAFQVSCSKPMGTSLDAPPGGGTIEYTYQADQNFVSNLAKENGVSPSDIQLFVYEAERSGGIQKFASGASAASSVSVGPIALHSGTFVMALACDTSLLGSKPKSGSVLTAGGGWVPSEVPPMTVVVEGEDESTTSPKTGQRIPAETAPLALAVAGALGAATLVIARRRTH